MQLCFFEDSKVDNFKPLNLTRPTCDLRIGSLTIQQKWENDLELTTDYIACPEHVQKIFNPDNLNPNDSQLWINSRLIPSSDVIDTLSNSTVNTVFIQDETVISAHLNHEDSVAFIKEQDNLKHDKFQVIEINDLSMINNLWDLLTFNSSEIENDIARLALKNISTFTHTPVFQSSTPEHIYIGKDVKIEAGVVLIADEGPIVIRDGAKILAGSLIRGPVSIGENATINMGAKIYGNTSIGTYCKIGGEVNSSIFHSYSNKGHDGFVGHSLIGQWVNLGADTNTSNLKNNYSHVRIANFETGEMINTGQQFFGSALGDHCKTAINTQLNTGTVAGVSCNIISNGFPPSYMKSFSWLGRDKVYDFKLDKALEVMRVMMKRRDIELTDDYIEMMKHISQHK